MALYYPLTHGFSTLSNCDTLPTSAAIRRQLALQYALQRRISVSDIRNEFDVLHSPNMRPQLKRQKHQQDERTLVNRLELDIDVTFECSQWEVVSQPGFELLDVELVKVCV